MVSFSWRAGLPAAVLALLSGCAPAERPPALPPGADADRGRLLLAQYQCGSCHAIPGVASSRGQVAQPLEAWGQRAYIAGRLPNQPLLLVQWIQSPQSLVPGTPMPSMGVSADDARDMAAYLLTLE